jgi:hypothetical protein
MTESGHFYRKWPDCPPLPSLEQAAPGRRLKWGTNARAQMTAVITGIFMLQGRLLQDIPNTPEAACKCN